MTKHNQILAGQKKRKTRQSDDEYGGGGDDDESGDESDDDGGSDVGAGGSQRASKPTSAAGARLGERGGAAAAVTGSPGHVMDPPSAALQTTQTARLEAVVPAVVKELVEYEKKVHHSLVPLTTDHSHVDAYTHAGIGGLCPTSR